MVEPFAPDVQAVLDNIVESATCMFCARDTVLFLLDGDRLQSAARFGRISPKPAGRQYLTLTSIAGRAVSSRGPFQVEDVQAADPILYRVARKRGSRTVLAVPLLHGEAAIGSLMIECDEVRPFTDDEVHVCQTFADFAATAIERARLAEDVEQRNRELAEALAYQTATREVLHFLGSQPTELPPALSAIVEAALRVTGGLDAFIRLLEGDRLLLVAHRGPL